ncbi:ABC transporter permease [Massilia sp. ST3]|uniref:ABC transporter permease n=1 Tax=Massilia sp. ST3 TaxID=2824903 RepID=UPI001B824C34|nr:ABC transporter permease [Massilia sp. ST3]MBQ5949416.1 ABC transporter permease [Massilia sp. ST3]
MWTIYLKEMRELLGETKTLIFTVLIPVFAIPVLTLGFGFVAAKLSEQAQNKVMEYAIVGAPNAPGLSEEFAKDKSFREVRLSPATSVKQAIEDDTVKFVLEVPPGLDTALQANQQARLRLHFNAASSGDVTRERVAKVVEAYGEKLREQQLPSLRLNQAQLDFVLLPIAIDEQSTANQRERIGALAGGLLPYFLLIVCLMAAMYPSIDLGAGEKENGTLETLLLAPIPRSHAVMGKFMVLLTIGFTSSVLMVASIGVLFGVFGSAVDRDLAEVASAIGFVDLCALALMLVPACAMFASVLLSMSIYARSYKEASGMMQPMLMLTILPVVLAMLPGVELNWMWATVPLTNIALAMKEVVKGTLDYRMLAMIMTSSILIAGALLMWCRWWFGREEVLFRD